MSQQRECCCSGVFEPECLHADKIFVHTEDEWTSSSVSRREEDYWDIASLASKDGAGYDQRIFDTLYRRKNSQSLYYETYGDNIKDQSSTTGMSCMLCNKVLMLNFRRPKFQFSQYAGLECPDPTGCCQENSSILQKFPGDFEKTQVGGAGGCANYNITYYDWKDTSASIREEPFNQMYLHWKDYWYMDFTAKGVPFTKRSEMSNTCNQLGGPCFGRLGVASYFINTQLGKCGGDPFPADANLMCHPELMRVTNPSNHFFYSRNNSDSQLKPINACHFTNKGMSDDPDCLTPVDTGYTLAQSLTSAALLHDPALIEDFSDNENPIEAELMHLYSGLVSNVNWLVSHLPEEGGLNPNFPGLTPQSAFVPGMSSWQCYTMQKSPNLRVLSDIATYCTPTDRYTYDGDWEADSITGTLFPTITIQRGNLPGDEQLPDIGNACLSVPEPGEQETRGFNNLYSTTVGTLYRVRLWCNSRALTITEPINPLRDNPCTGTDNTGTPVCTTDNGNNDCNSRSNDFWDCQCDGDTCKGYAKPMFPCNYGIDEFGSGYDRLGGYLGVDPPLSNDRLLFDKPSGPFGPNEVGGELPPNGDFNVSAGYHDFVRQNSGPWGIMYFCSGTPIFLHDLCELQNSDVDWTEADTDIILQAFSGNLQDYSLPVAPNEDDGGTIGDGGDGGGGNPPPVGFRQTQTDIAGDRYTVSDGEITYLTQDEVPFAKSVQVGTVDANCINDIIGNVLGPAVEKLGNLGVSKIQDFRDDQAAKLRTIEIEFKRIAEENKDKMESEVYDYLSTFAFGQEIYDHLKTTELLPVQKTHKFLNPNLINYSTGKERVYNEYAEDPDFVEWNMSGDMQEHQISEVLGYDTDRFGDKVVNLRINQYDPWIQGKLGIASDRTPLRMPLDNGNGGRGARIFNWQYPVEDFQTKNSIWDPDFLENPIEDWEKALWEVWWPNMPVYFHASPGGWNWSGTGGWGQPWRKIQDCGEDSGVAITNHSLHRTNSGMDIRLCYDGSCNYTPVAMKNQNTQASGSDGNGGFRPDTNVLGPYVPEPAEIKANYFYQKTSYPTYDESQTSVGYEPPQSMLNGDPNVENDRGLENLYQIRHGTFTQQGTLPFPCETLKYEVGTQGSNVYAATAYMTQPRDQRPRTLCQELSQFCSNVMSPADDGGVFEASGDVLVCNPPCFNENTPIFPSEVHPDDASDYLQCLNRLVDADDILSWNERNTRPCFGCPTRCNEENETDIDAACSKPLAGSRAQDVEIHRPLCEEFGNPYDMVRSGFRMYIDNRLNKFRPDVSDRFGDPNEKRKSLISGDPKPNTPCANNACNSLGVPCPETAGENDCYECSCPDGFGDCLGSLRTGACCDGQNCEDSVDCVTCNEQGGSFHHNATCEDNPCDPPLPDTSCCTNGVCENGISETTCALQGGVFRNELNCPDTLCDDEFGECLLGFPTGCGQSPSEAWYRHVSEQQAPDPPTAPCTGSRTHDTLKSCGLTHIQATKGFLRIVHSLSINYSAYKSAKCPNYGGGSIFDESDRCDASSCCCSHKHISPCANCYGEPDDELPRIRPAEPAAQFICDVYPFKYRCQQTADIDGLQRCGLLDEPLDIFSGDESNAESAEEFIPKVFYGHEDPLSCISLEITNTQQQWDCDDEECILEIYSENQDPDDQPGCSPDPQSVIYDTTRACRCVGNAVTCGYTRNNVKDEDISPGSYCNAIGWDDVLGASSLDLSGDTFKQPMGFYLAGGPNLIGNELGPIVMGVPQSNCFRIATKNNEELPNPSRLPNATLRRCADYYLDKTISDLSGTFQEPPLEYSVEFADYSDKNWNEGGGTDGDDRPLYEYVDFQATTASENFWATRKYSGLKNIRFFGIDPGTARDASSDPSSFRNGGFSGGQVSGQFVGTMVMNFGSSAEFRSFDDDMGHEDLYLKLPAGCTFYARPSFNRRWDSADHNESIDGWIGDTVAGEYAAGLVPRFNELIKNRHGYAESGIENLIDDDGNCISGGVPNEDGECPGVWEQTGKVYEIGVPTESSGDCPLFLSAGYPAGPGVGSENDGVVERFVGCGPFEFRDRTPFTIQIVPAGSNGTRVRDGFGLPDVGEEGTNGYEGRAILRCSSFFSG